jgi:hypothetical protein
MEKGIVNWKERVLFLCKNKGFWLKMGFWSGGGDGENEIMWGVGGCCEIL